MKATLTDCIDVKGRVAVEYGATGVIAIFSTDESGPKVGDALLVVRPDGWMIRATVRDAKPHPQAYGVFLADLTKRHVPVGSTLRWGDQFWPNATENRTLIETAMTF